MKVAYIPMGAAGHILASLPMVGELVKKGVEVTYFAPERFRDQVEASGVNYVPMPIVAADGPVDGGDDFLAGIPLVFLGEACGVIDTIMPALEADMPDAIIADALAIAGRLAAWKLNLPLIEMFTSFSANEHFAIDRFWPKYPDTNPARAKALEIAKDLQEKFGGPLLTCTEIFEGTGDFNIVTQPKSFHPAGETFDPKKYFFAGAQVAKRADSGTWQPPTNGKPLLYTSLGSLFNNWPEFYQMLFPVVKDMDINVLCSIGNALKPEDLGEIPENVQVMAFTPQLEVLEHCDYFFTHAGTGSVMEALYFGVPCFCIPQMDEQIFTAGLMVEKGLACASLKKDEVTEDALRENLTKLINDPSFKKNAQAVADEMHTQGGCERAAQAVIDYLNK